MERLLETHHLGSHRADVIEHIDGGRRTYLVLVDGVVASDPPLEKAPRERDVERIFARSQARSHARV